MKFLANFFFFTYIGLVVLAGFWGAFVNPEFDFRMLFKLDTDTLTSYSQINLISQYRFLRALELGYGIFSLMFYREIFTEKKFNYLYLWIMLSGALARIVAIAIDGMPSTLFMFFLIYELLGVIVIFAYTNRQIKTSLNSA
ncbi:DUF4345 domain-containing protein [Fulvivirga sp. RKSG066]|uniref:DUF4345 family protein n=1 Tax=Fulvivirga aurantia TaxID=2529383 RepID=UPI0012BD2157|nr:DUF4345 family protein [Fulvivirga aurantia]MTI23155.1 DUF4345 domain-containing protein [Fulvivirga aurantia]